MVQTGPKKDIARAATRTSDRSFGLVDWSLLAATALMWGSSFVWIEEGLEAFPPTLVTLIRIGLGAATLALFPQSRQKVARADLVPIAILGVVWMAIPFLLFPIAQQWIDSSLAGMINGATPIFATLIAAFIVKALPARTQIVGLVLGFVGVVVVGWPAISNARATAVGAFLVLVATFLYGIAINLSAPLQQKYGSLPVLLRAQLFALAVVAIPGMVVLPQATFHASSALAMLPLGAFGTGLAFVCMTTLVGRVGPSRGSVTVYFVPLVAIAMGPLFRNETLERISVGGMVMVLGGAWLASRKPISAADRAKGMEPAPEGIVTPEGKGSATTGVRG